MFSPLADEGAIEQSAVLCPVAGGEVGEPEADPSVTPSGSIQSRNDWAKPHPLSFLFTSLPGNELECSEYSFLHRETLSFGNRSVNPVVVRASPAS